jgi:hypothetical protein
MTPKVKIGSAYQPERREWRGNHGEIQSYRGWPDRDMARLQEALLRDETMLISEVLWAVVGIGLFLALLAGILFIGPEVIC